MRTRSAPPPGVPAMDVSERPERDRRHRRDRPPRAVDPARRHHDVHPLHCAQRRPPSDTTLNETDGRRRDRSSCARRLCLGDGLWPDATHHAAYEPTGYRRLIFRADHPARGHRCSDDHDNPNDHIDSNDHSHGGRRPRSLQHRRLRHPVRRQSGRGNPFAWGESFGHRIHVARGGGPFDGPSDADSINAMLSWHINAVRIPLNEQCWLGLNGLPAAYTPTEYQQAVADYVTLLTSKNIYTIIELHWAAPGTTQATGQTPMPDRDHSPRFGPV